MSRLDPPSAAWISLLIAAFSTSAGAQPPAPCKVVADPVFNLRVDKQAVVDHACIEIKKGKTDVVWLGDAEVSYLRIEFKPGDDRRPAPPVCTGASCTLEKAKHASKTGTFYYSVEVELKSGEKVKVDPMLIIKP